MYRYDEFDTNLTRERIGEYRDQVARRVELVRIGLSLLPTPGSPFHVRSVLGPRHKDLRKHA